MVSRLFARVSCLKPLAHFSRPALVMIACGSILAQIADSGVASHLGMLLALCQEATNPWISVECLRTLAFAVELKGEEHGEHAGTTYKSFGTAERF
jgi:hypothetical protein